MTTLMNLRLAALKSQSGGRRTACHMCTAELHAILAPLFGGRVPTHDELQVLADREQQGGEHGNA